MELQIEQKLDDIFKNRFGIEMSEIKEQVGDMKFLSQEFGMASRDLLYLYFDIEKEFLIKIPQEVIISGEFSTYNNVFQIIYHELQHE
jgi:peptide maturation system acyl carrier-related protein